MSVAPSHLPRSRKVTLLLWVQIFVGSMQMLGAMFEVLNMLVPSMLSGIQDNEIMQIHRDEPLVAAWTTLGNAIGLGLGIGLVVGGVRLLRGDLRGLRLTRLCAQLTILYAIVGAIVSAVYLVPLVVPLINAADPQQKIMALVFLSSMAGSASLFILFPLVLLRVLRPATVSAYARAR